MALALRPRAAKKRAIMSESLQKAPAPGAQLLSRGLFGSHAGFADFGFPATTKKAPPPAGDGAFDSPQRR
jgi:hypothetical protein